MLSKKLMRQMKGKTYKTQKQHNSSIAPELLLHNKPHFPLDKLNMSK